MALSRRDFLKFTSLTAGGTALGLSDTGLVSELMAMGIQPPYSVSRVPTYCEMCFWNCGAIATVVNDRVVKLEGNPVNPRSRGKLCARGHGGIGQLYDPDRLKYPMVRTGKRGDGQYRRASWNEALNIVAGRMAKIRDKYGPESVAFMMHGGVTKHLMTLRGAFRSPNFAFPSFGQCRGARVVAYELTFGMDVGSPERVDLKNSRAAVFFGTHLGENMHNSQVQDFTEAIGRKSKIIVVDPRFSTAAGKAAYWLPIKPGTDMALMLAWINYLIETGIYDREYVNKYTTGFQELQSSVRKYTPQWAAEETEISESRIIETAKIIGANAPSVCIHPGRFAAWDGKDTQRERCLAILSAILGTWGRKGGIYLPTQTGLNKLKGKGFPAPSRPGVTKGNHPFAKPQLMQEVRRATITENPYPIKGWIVAGTNVMKSIPDQRETLQAVNNLDLLVAIDILPYDTVMMADVILPECTYLERHDALMEAKGRALTLSIRQPAVKPLHESKEGWWIAKELAKRLALDEYFPYTTYEDYIKEECAAMQVSYDKLKQYGTLFFKNTSKPYITEDNKPVFHTPSGKIELYSRQLKDAGFDPVPQYASPETPDEGWFRLLFGRSPVHTFSRTTNNQRLHELYKENAVWINADSALNMGISQDQYVVLVNQDGVRSNPVKARVTQRIRKDCVFMVHGFGSMNRGLKLASGKGADDQKLITKYVADPISGSTGMRVNFIKIVKVNNA